MLKLTKGQTAVLALAATPMAAVGVAGAVATYVNMNHVLHRGASALGLVAAGEGATLICALVALAVTLMGQHTPATVRAGMWLVPLAASGVGIALAPTGAEAVVMAFTPLAMTAAGEGVAFVARRVVAYRTGADIEQQRRSGLLLWHANRAANGRGIGRRISRAAVWRLTKCFAATDAQLSVQLGEIQRFRISQGADENLAAVLTRPVAGPESPAVAPAAAARSIAPAAAPEAADGRSWTSHEMGGYRSISKAPISDYFRGVHMHAADVEEARRAKQWCDPKDTLDVLAETMAEVGEAVNNDPSVKLLTTAEAAALKGCAPGTIRSLKHRGRLAYTMVDGVPMYHPNDVLGLD